MHWVRQAGHSPSRTSGKPLRRETCSPKCGAPARRSADLRHSTHETARASCRRWIGRSTACGERQPIAMSQANRMKSEPSIDAVAAEKIAAIRTNAAHFPSHIQSRGRSYLAEGRVGPLEVERNRISATVRGRRNYRTIWQWDGTTANPRCTCPEG